MALQLNSLFFLIKGKQGNLEGLGICLDVPTILYLSLSTMLVELLQI